MHVAFLRGMNLGGRRITNDELAAAVAGLGFLDVGTYRASGNVFFRAPDGMKPAEVRPRLESGLQQALGYPVPAVLRSVERVAALGQVEPFPPEIVEATAGKLQVALVADEPDAATRAAVLEHATPEDHLAFDGRDLLWLPKQGISTSPIDWSAIERLLGLVTVRTRGTMAGLAKKLAS